MSSIIEIIKLEDGSKRNLTGLSFSNCLGIILRTYNHNIHGVVIAKNVDFVGPVYNILVNNTFYYLCLMKYPSGDRYILYNFVRGLTTFFEEYYTTAEQNIRFI